MEVDSIVAEIDAEIARLTEARRVLKSVGTPGVVKKAGRGRPKGSKNAATSVKAEAPATTKKRKLSPEGRKRIAEAMKKRWAERKGEAA
jgi:hypothetical protein